MITRRAPSGFGTPQSPQVLVISVLLVFGDLAHTIRAEEMRDADLGECMCYTEISYAGVELTI